MNIKKNWPWIILALALFLCSAFFLGPLWIKYLSSQKANQIEGPSPVEPEKNSDLIKTDVKSSGENLKAVVRYLNNRFVPEKIKLKNDYTGFGCLLKIINESSKPLTIRLGPYPLSKRENYGRKYDPIPVKDFMIIDPRFGKGSEEFLNLRSPEEKFFVEIDKSCLPE